MRLLSGLVGTHVAANYTAQTRSNVLYGRITIMNDAQATIHACNHGQINLYSYTITVEESLF